MNTVRLRLPRWLSFLALILAFALLRFALGLRFVSTFAWLFPVFMMAWVRSNKPAWGLLLGWVSSILAVALFTLPVAHLWEGTPIYWVVSGAVGTLFFLPFVVDRLVSHRLSGIPSTLVFPLAWVTLEFLSSSSPYMGTAYVLGLTQFDSPLITQISSIAGVSAITFLMAWLAPVVCLTLENRFQWSRVARPVLLFLAVLIGVGCFGGIRLGLDRPASSTVRVAGVTASSRDGTLNSGGSLLNKYVPPAAAAGARIVVIHEVAISIAAEDEAALIEVGQQLARQEGVYLLVGLQVNDEDRSLPFEDKAVFISPDGELLADYTKQRLMPNELAYYIRGEAPAPVLETPYGNIAIVICSDAPFPDYVRRQVRGRDVDILLVPAWDFRGAEQMWSQYVSFRAIENGFAMFRVVREGLTLAVDHHGRPLVQSNYFTSQPIIYADLPADGQETVYTLLGDWFAWLSIAGLVLLLVMAIAKPESEGKKMVTPDQRETT